MKKLINGFNEKCSNEEYHADREYKSSSALKMMLKDPRQFYKTYVLNEPQNFNSDALSIGSYIHTRILEPHLLEEEYAIYTGSRRSGDVWKKFKEEAGDKIIITASQKSLSDKMLDTFNEANVKLGNHGNEKEVLISSFFNGGEAEETLAGVLNGYKVKTRFDYRKEFDDFGSINDVKTTNIALGSATLEDVEDICTYWGYDLSSALYVDLATEITGKPHDFYFVFLSKKDFQTRIFKASEGMLERGRAMYKEAIERLKEAEKTGIYFENKIQELR
jgi:exodeoxyribonuclease VIII